MHCIKSHLKRVILIGKDFKKELEVIKETHDWALRTSIVDMVNAIKEIENKSLISIGSGGSLSGAQFAATLHQEYTGNISKHITPLELASIKYPKNAVFMFITSGGRNKDVIHSLEILIEKEPKSIIILTASENTPLTKLANKYKYIRILCFSMPSKKDGFLATNSLYGFCTLLARSYQELYGDEFYLSEELPSFSVNINNSNSTSVLNPNEIPIFLKNRTICALYSHWASPAAFDLESKFSEAALGNVQITDYRNFGHGRHNWLDKKGESTCVILFITPDCKLLAKKTMEIIPSEIPIIKIETSHEKFYGTLSLLLGVFDFVKTFGDLCGINPGKPKVAEFGRKLYHLGWKKNFNTSLNKPILANPNHQLFIERKIGDESLINESYVKKVFKDSEKHLKKYIDKLKITQFGGIILDYDGTMCEPDKRFDKPSDNIIKTIIHILESDIIIGIATGRGKSIRETLQPLIPKNRWKQVIIGYYNGGDIGNLSQDNVPDKSASSNSLLMKFEEAMVKSELINFLKYEMRPNQITIEPANHYSLDYIYDLLNELRFKLHLNSISIFKSSHSLDILAPNISKTCIFENIRLRLDESLKTLPILSIGDKGKWPGNDFELLNNYYSLSVDECSFDLDADWNLAPVGYKRTQATEYYLNALKPKGNGIFEIYLDR